MYLLFYLKWNIFITLSFHFGLAIFFFLFYIILKTGYRHFLLLFPSRDFYIILIQHWHRKELFCDVLLIRPTLSKIYEKTAEIWNILKNYVMFHQVLSVSFENWNFSQSVILHNQLVQTCFCLILSLFFFLKRILQYLCEFHIYKLSWFKISFTIMDRYEIKTINKF